MREFFTPVLSNRHSRVLIPILTFITRALVHVALFVLASLARTRVLPKVLPVELASPHPSPRSPSASGGTRRPGGPIGPRWTRTLVARSGEELSI